MNLDEEARLYTTNTEREKTENLATLYSIIVSLEYLERAYVRDSVSGKECARSVHPGAIADSPDMHQRASGCWHSTSRSSSSWATRLAAWRRS